MPYDRPHMLLTWEGDITNGSSSAALDNFAGSLRFADPSFQSFDAAVDTDEVFTDIANVFRTYWQSGALGIPGNHRVRVMKWNRIGTDGRYVNRNYTRRLEVGFNQAGQAKYPHQVAVVATWLTDKQRGLASRGRTFWPTVFDIAASGYLAPGAIRQAINGYGGLIQVLNDAIPGPTRACVMSDLREGATNEITGVNVGDRFDIQRRRGSKLPELYQGANLAQLPLT